MNKSKNLVILASILGLSVIFGAYFYIFNRIILVNNSKYFLASKNNMQIFNKYLGEWGVWKKDNVMANDSLTKHAVKRIKIVLTDEVQTFFGIEDNNNPPNLLAGSRTSIDKDTMTVSIYLSPQLAKSGNTEAINKDFLFLLVNALYRSTYDKEVTEKNQQEGNHVGTPAIKEFYDNPSIRPFVIRTITK